MKIECNKCGFTNSDANFCTKCGNKLQELCYYCWVKKQPYNCGEEKCPSYRLNQKVTD